MNLALQHHSAGRLPQADAIYRQILQSDPNQPDALHLLGVLAHQVGENASAVDLIAKALSIKPDFAEAHNNLGNALKKLGRLDEAVACFQRALSLKPEYIDAHNNLGNTLRELDRLDEAIVSYNSVLAINPEKFETHYNLAGALIGLERLEEAVVSYNKALAIKPDHVGAHDNLCEALERTNRTEDLREAVSVARRHCSEAPRLALREAQLLKRDGDYVAARAVLQAVEDPVDVDFTVTRAFQLGDLSDRLEDTRTAFDYFSEGNRLCSKTAEAKRIDAAAYMNRIEVLANRFTPDWVANWQDLDSGDDGAGLVFLVGFPRSGTTLLNTILRSHPDISVVEERPTVEKLLYTLDQLPGSYPDNLSDFDPAQLADLRQAYFAELDKYLDPTNQSMDQSTLVIDKNPLNFIDAGLIHRIFPAARFVFSQRHPCDCVLSCFMQNFKLSPSLANLLTLEDAAGLYDNAMTLWRQYRAVLPLAVHTVRYENLIDAFEETLTPVFDFLGLKWHENVRNYAESAMHHSDVRTPSYNQVTQSLYTQSRDRWKRYQDHMQPVLPVLLPWVRHFDYAE